MSIQTREVEYEHDGTHLQGSLTWDDAWTQPQPGVLIAHDAMKSDAGFEEGRARVLAETGYAGFVLDVYGKDIRATDNESSYALMQPFQADRGYLYQRLLSAVETAAALPEVDSDRMAAIGYCFGGMCVLDLARFGAPLRGVVSFHGLLDGPDPEKTALPSGPIDARVLALHGWDDPFVPSETVAPFAREMSARDADWQFHAFGNTLHSFTNPFIDLPEMGAAYDAKAERRSWQSLENFLSEIFE